ncbi:MAG: glycosyltransferase family 2 protein [Deltaproteobacteria bacterium]|nr:MAG: glycosyltransferase family 2 protein [Deltaproteobacteria bacterium]
MKTEAAGLSFVIPAYNEERSIVDTLTRVRTALQGLDIPSEIILVNDGSRDGTREQAAMVEGVTVISHPINIGYGNAIKTGVRNARYAWVGIVDADGSYPIEEIPRLVDEMHKGFDLVVGVRENVREIDSFVKNIFRTIYKKLVKFLNDSRIEDANSGFRIMRREALLEILPFLCGTFSFTTSMTIFMTGRNRFVRYVPTRYHKREGKSKVKHLRDSFRTMQYILQGVLYFNPVKFFLLLALATLLLVGLPALLLALLKQDGFLLACLAAGSTVALIAALAAHGEVVRLHGTGRGLDG